MPCNATSQLTNAPSVPLQVTMPTNNAQWAVFVQRLQDAINATRDAANRTGVNVVPAAYAVYDAAALPALSINGASAALDGTKSQFGKASLKLTATAATVSVSFTGYPIAITAYQRWIESVYIQSSRASIAGTLAVVTPSASYPVDISGTLLPATWGRLYGDCSLVADASTQATMTLTLTGCSVGDTFNLEGWQMEQAAGNTNLPSAFVNSAAPGSQDTLPDGSSFVRLAGSHASGNVAYNYKGVWASVTAYVTGDEVVYSGSYWLCLTGNTNSAPAQGNGNWQVVGAYNNYQGAWSSTVTYYAGQETTYNGNYWVAAATNTNSAPSTSNANWVIAGPTNLDKVADGTARFAVVNAAGMKGVSSVDANNRAGIDFTQSVHIGKSAENIAYTAPGTSAIAQTIQARLKADLLATDFGADPTGVQDSTGAMQAAINAAIAASATLRIPAGKYVVGALTYVPTSFNNEISIVGAGSATTILQAPSGATQPTLTVGSPSQSYFPSGFNFSGIQFGGVSTQSASIVAYNVNSSAWSDLLIAGAQTGLELYACINLTLTNCEIEQCAQFGINATHMASGPNTVVNMLTLDGCRLVNCGTTAFQVDYGGHIKLSRCDIEGNGPASSPTTASAIACGFNMNAGQPGVTLEGCWFEANNGTVQVQFDSGANAINDCLFVESGTAPKDLYVAGGTYMLRNIRCMSSLAPNVAESGSVGSGNWIISCAIPNISVDPTKTQVMGGTAPNVYAIAGNDVLVSGGYNRIGLRVAGSGQQIADQRNVPPIATANLRSKWSGQTISYSATAGTPATATISVTAASLLNGGSPIPYNAMSVGVSGTGGNTVTYYLYCDDAAYAGGAQTLVATTTGSDIYGSNSRVYVGSCAVTFPTSGSGSGSGSGGGGACVVVGAFGPSGRFDRDTACVDTPTGAVRVRNLKTSHQKCVRVEYNNATILTCSEDAPLMDGARKVFAVDALGEILDTSEGPSRVCSVESVGIKEVVSIDAGDVAYYAADNPDGPFALHHNKIIP